MKNNTSNNQQNAETKAELMKKLDDLCDQLNELRIRINAPVGYGGDPLLAGNRADLSADEAALADKLEKEIYAQMGDYEKEIHKIQKKLGIDKVNKPDSTSNSNSDLSDDDLPF